MQKKAEIKRWGDLRELMGGQPEVRRLPACLLLSQLWMILLPVSSCLCLLREKEAWLNCGVLFSIH